LTAGPFSPRARWHWRAPRQQTVRRRRNQAQKRFSTSPQSQSRSQAKRTCFRSAVSIASAATTPRIAIERGSDPTREPPFFFQKPTDAIQYVGVGEVAAHPYPSLTRNYHHEVELVAALKSGGSNISPEKALDHVYGYALGLDMTRRDLQNGMAAEKKPWEIGKSFDHAAVIGPILPVTKSGHLTKGAISLAVNGTVRQASDLDKMIWSVAEQIAKLSEAFELKAGDIIYSGTPENVGPVVKGDVLLCKLDGLPDMSIRIV
jgi:fumarylpyruvate hydrolase